MHGALGGVRPGRPPRPPRRRRSPAPRREVSPRRAGRATAELARAAPTSQRGRRALAGVRDDLDADSCAWHQVGVEEGHATGRADPRRSRVPCSRAPSTRRLRERGEPPTARRCSASSACSTSRRRRRPARATSTRQRDAARLAIDRPSRGADGWAPVTRDEPIQPMTPKPSHTSAQSEQRDKREQTRSGEPVTTSTPDGLVAGSRRADLVRRGPDEDVARGAARPFTSSPNALAGASPATTLAPRRSRPGVRALPRSAWASPPASVSETIPWNIELEKTSTEFVWSTSDRSAWRPSAVVRSVGTVRQRHRLHARDSGGRRRPSRRSSRSPPSRAAGRAGRCRPSSADLQRREQRVGRARVRAARRAWSPPGRPSVEVAAASPGATDQPATGRDRGVRRARARGTRRLATGRAR